MPQPIRKRQRFTLKVVGGVTRFDCWSVYCGEERIGQVAMTRSEEAGQFMKVLDQMGVKLVADGHGR